MPLITAQDASYATYENQNTTGIGTLRELLDLTPKIQKSPVHSANRVLWAVLDCRSEREVILHGQRVDRSLLLLSVSQNAVCYGVVFLDFPPLLPRSLLVASMG